MPCCRQARGAPPLDGPPRSGRWRLAWALATCAGLLGASCGAHNPCRDAVARDLARAQLDLPAATRGPVDELEADPRVTVTGDAIRLDEGPAPWCPAAAVQPPTAAGAPADRGPFWNDVVQPLVAGALPDGALREPGGYLLPTLADAAESARHRARAALQESPAPFPGRVTVFVAGSLPFSLVSRVLYSLGQAQFEHMALAVRSPAGVRTLPLALPRACAAASAPHGPESAPGPAPADALQTLLAGAPAGPCLRPTVQLTARELAWRFDPAHTGACLVVELAPPPDGQDAQRDRLRRLGAPDGALRGILDGVPGGLARALDGLPGVAPASRVPGAAAPTAVSPAAAPPAPSLPLGDDWTRALRRGRGFDLDDFGAALRRPSLGEPPPCPTASLLVADDVPWHDVVGVMDALRAAGYLHVLLGVVL